MSTPPSSWERPVESMATRTGLSGDAIAVLMLVGGILVLIFDQLLNLVVGGILVALGAYWLFVSWRSRRPSPPPEPPRGP